MAAAGGRGGRAGILPLMRILILMLILTLTLTPTPTRILILILMSAHANLECTGGCGAPGHRDG